jgi:hypothetical protein
MPAMFSPSAVSAQIWASRGTPKQLVQIRGRAAGIRSGHDRHLPFADTDSAIMPQYPAGYNLS